MPTLLKTVVSKTKTSNHAPSKSNVEEMRAKSEEEANIQQLMTRGFTREQATHLYAQELKQKSANPKSNPSDWPPASLPRSYTAPSPPTTILHSGLVITPFFYIWNFISSCIGITAGYNYPLPIPLSFSGSALSPPHLQGPPLHPPAGHVRRNSNSMASVQSTVVSRQSFDSMPLTNEETADFQRLLRRGYSYEAAQQIILGNRNSSAASVSVSISSSGSSSGGGGGSRQPYSTYSHAPTEVPVYSRSVENSINFNKVTCGSMRLDWSRLNLLCDSSLLHRL